MQIFSLTRAGSIKINAPEYRKIKIIQYLKFRFEINPVYRQPSFQALEFHLHMERDKLNRRIIQAKQTAGLKWSDISEAIGRSPGWTISALFGQHEMTVKEAQALGSLLMLTAEETQMLVGPAVRGASAPLNDPLIHRLHEMFNVNGAAIKQLIMEEFGDGVVSAIDFKFHVKRVAHPDGDRAQITLDGKFLPFTPW